MNEASSISPYQQDIIALLGCSQQDAAMVEDIMRCFVFHSTLDWQSRTELKRGAREAWAMLKADREMFEQDHASRRRLIETM
jgi:hypothetical protein